MLVEETSRTHRADLFRVIPIKDADEAGIAPFNVILKDLVCKSESILRTDGARVIGDLDRQGRRSSRIGIGRRQTGQRVDIHDEIKRGRGSAGVGETIACGVKLGVASAGRRVGTDGNFRRQTVHSARLKWRRGGPATSVTKTGARVGEEAQAATMNGIRLNRPNSLSNRKKPEFPPWPEFKLNRMGAIVQQSRLPRGKPDKIPALCNVHSDHSSLPVRHRAGSGDLAGDASQLSLCLADCRWRRFSDLGQCAPLAGAHAARAATAILGIGRVVRGLSLLSGRPAHVAVRPRSDPRWDWP